MHLVLLLLLLLPPDSLPSETTAIAILLCRSSFHQGVADGYYYIYEYFLHMNCHEEMVIVGAGDANNLWLRAMLCPFPQLHHLPRLPY